jgi:acyl-homoserine-lactone acylase
MIAWLSSKRMYSMLKDFLTCAKASMKTLVLILAIATASFAFQKSKDPDVVRWEQEARDVTIFRDNWGIAHVYGKTDADAVFGMEYAQAEDDFNRVETNYINAMGRLAEVEGESKIYQDLRMKLFIDPGTLKTEYTASPAWSAHS